MNLFKFIEMPNLIINRIGKDSLIFEVTAVAGGWGAGT